MLFAAYEPNGNFPGCLRREPRTNMFVMADLAGGDAAGTVKVRNMSPSGAMVEGPALPAMATVCCLSRAGIALRGAVVWTAGGRAGLRFDDPAIVSQWLPAGPRTQDDVDRTVAEAKQARTHIVPSPPSRVFSKPVSASDAALVADTLESLADDLAADPAVVARHMHKLQALDLAVQTLRKIADGQAD